MSGSYEIRASQRTAGPNDGFIADGTLYCAEYHPDILLPA